VIVVYGGGGKRKVGIVGHAKSSIRVCRRPFWESGQQICIYNKALVAQLVKRSCLLIWLCSRGHVFDSLVALFLILCNNNCSIMLDSMWSLAD
jgi:hypothetical protein